MQTFVYDWQLKENILVVGKTVFGKTTSVQRLAVNNIFGKLEKAKWVLQIRLSKQRKAQIQSCFICPLEFYYPKNVDEHDDLPEEIKKDREGVVDDTDSAAAKTDYGQNKRLDWLIVMDDVSCIADKSNVLASSSTISRKLHTNSVYIFHIIYPEKSIWKLNQYLSRLRSTVERDENYSGKLYSKNGPLFTAEFSLAQ